MAPGLYNRIKHKFKRKSVSPPRKPPHRTSSSSSENAIPLSNLASSANSPSNMLQSMVSNNYAVPLYQSKISSQSEVYNTYDRDYATLKLFIERISLSINTFYASVIKSKPLNLRKLDELIRKLHPVSSYKDFKQNHMSYYNEFIQFVLGIARSSFDIRYNSYRGLCTHTMISNLLSTIFNSDKFEEYMDSDRLPIDIVVYLLIMVIYYILDELNPSHYPVMAGLLYEHHRIKFESQYNYDDSSMTILTKSNKPIDSHKAILAYYRNDYLVNLVIEYYRLHSSYFNSFRVFKNELDRNMVMTPDFILLNNITPCLFGIDNTGEKVPFMKDILYQFKQLNQFFCIRQDKNCTAPCSVINSKCSYDEKHCP